MIRTITVIVSRILLVLMLSMLSVTAASAANCYPATAQGATGPADWQSFCWIDFSSYNNATATSASGQTFSLTLQDGTVLSFVMKVTGTALAPTASPSWSGSAIGNTAMTGIAGAPVLYSTGSGVTTATISAITLTPPAGATGATNYMIVLADGESTNTSETLTFTTNGGGWQTLDQAGPISGSTYPAMAGTGTSVVTETGADGNVGAYIFGSTRPSQVIAGLTSGGLEGFMMAVRFASIRLTMNVANARANSADQFTYAINSTTNSATLASGTSSGTGLGPFNTAGLSTAASVPLTLVETMAAGSVSTLSHYQTKLTCTNSTSGTGTVLPNAVTTTSYSLGGLAYGDALLCTFTSTPFPHLTLQKALGTGGRRYNTDQFTMTIAQGGTALATTTTAGTGTTLTSAATAQTQVSAGSAYTLSEAASGTTTLNQYTSAMACTNAWTGSTTVLPTTSGGSITPVMGDIVSCTLTNTRVAANALLTIAKSSAVVSDPVNGSSNPKFIPGAIVAYTLTVANTGPTAVDNNTVLIIDTLPTQLSVGTAASPSFIQGSPTSGLTFTSGTDIAYSKSATMPANYAACTYTPVAAYDPLVRYICLNPKGTMAGSSGSAPSFSITVNTKVN